MHEDQRFELGRRMLLAILGGMIVFGLSLVLFDNRHVPGLHVAINQVLWQRDDMPAEVVTYHRFVHAVLGATIASWALALALVVQHAMARRERWAWWAVAASTAIWFVPDTSASLWWGVWPNAIFNVACLATFAVPLAMTWRRA